MNHEPRWRIRRTPTHRWAVDLRVHTPTFGAVHVPLGTWDTWADAITYVNLTHARNYGKAAA